jgi:hypothetical protein
MTGIERPPEATPEDLDAAKRLAEAVNLHVSVQRAELRDRPGYVAVRLSDGRSPDGVLYDTRRDAARHHLHDLNIFFVRVGRDSMSPNEALVVLKFNRQARANGVIFSEEEVVTPNRLELIPRAFVRRRLTGRHD